MTLSDVYAVPGAAADPAAARITLEKRARVGPRARAQEPSVPRVTAAAKVVWVDLLAAWWLPESIPTVSRAWAERIPDRDRVPGDNGFLYGAWLGWNHTVGLAVPLAVTALVGVLAPAVWIVRHPARFALAAVIAVPVVVAVASAR